MEELLRLVRNQQKQLDALQAQLKEKKRPSPSNSDEKPSPVQNKKTRRQKTPLLASKSTLGRSDSLQLLDRQRAIRMTKSPQEQHVMKSMGRMHCCLSPKF